MALTDCIEKALKARRIIDKQVQDIKRLVDQEQGSEQEVLERFIQRARDAKRRVQLQAIATKKNLDLIKSHPKGVGRGVLALLTRDIEVPSGILAEGDPEPIPIMRSARQMIEEADSDLKVGDLLKGCLLGG